MKERAHVFIKGYVQGVGFRWFVRDIATSLHLSGWVRNLPQGSVEAVFEGEKTTISKAVERCSNGPSSAVVSEIKTDWKEPPENLAGFEIRF